MLKLLALEASAEACSVALATPNTELMRVSFEQRRHAQALLPMVEELLQHAQLSLTDLDAIAYSSGPGSFTGLRIAFGIAQGLAFGAGLPMVPVSSLQALAHAALQKYQSEGQGALVALDARMGEIYWAVYERQGQNCVQRVAPQLHSIADAAERMQIWLAEQSDTCWIAAGPGMALVPTLTRSNLAIQDPQHLPEALAVAQLVQRESLSVCAETADQAQLVYLRNSISWNKRQRIRK